VRSEYRVVTPESVEFVYELAGPGSRMLAALFDHLAIFGILITLWAATLFLGCLALLVILPLVALGILASFAVYFGYFVYFEWRWNGQTPGKRWMDLRVIDDRGLNIDLFQAFTRNLLRLVDMMPALLALDFIGVGFYAVGGATVLLNARQKRLGDWAAGTLVVRARRGVVPEAIIAPRDKYNTLQEAGVANRIRSRLSLQERETLLQLCLRRNELEFEVRQALFAAAAEYLEDELGIRREGFLSEEKFVQNITAIALAG